MKEEAAEKKVLSAQVTVEGDRSIFLVDGLQIEIARNSDVTVYKTNGVKMRPGIPEVVAKKDLDAFEVSKTFNKIAAYGAQVEFVENGGVVVSTNGEVNIQPPTAGAAAAADGGDANKNRRDRISRQPVPGVTPGEQSTAG
jgi:hypothetical protein